MECLQCVSLPTSLACAHGAPVLDRAGHWVIPDLHPGYEAESSAPEDCEGDRAGGVHKEDRLHGAAHFSLWARRDLWERTRVCDWRRPWRNLPDGREYVRVEGTMGERSRPTATRV